MSFIGYIPEEIFTCYIPSDWQWREKSPTLVINETGRTVITTVQLYQIAFFIIIVDTPEESGYPIVCISTGSSRRFRCCIQCRHRIGDQRILLPRQTSCLIQLRIKTCHHFKVMTAFILFKIIGIDIRAVIILFIIIFVHNGTAGSITSPWYRIRITVTVMREDR